MNLINSIQKQVFLTISGKKRSASILVWEISENYWDKECMIVG